MQKGSTEIWTRIAGLKVQSANPSHHRTLSGDFAMTFEVHCYVFFFFFFLRVHPVFFSSFFGCNIFGISQNFRTMRLLPEKLLCLSWLGKVFAPFSSFLLFPTMKDIKMKFTGHRKVTRKGSMVCDGLALWTFNPVMRVQISVEPFALFLLFFFSQPWKP